MEFLKFWSRNQRLRWTVGSRTGTIFKLKMETKMESQFWEKKNQNQTGIAPLKVLETGSQGSSMSQVTNQKGWQPPQVLQPLSSGFTYGMLRTGIVCV